MEKRQLPDGPNARQRIYLIGRLRKASKWATLFAELCAIKGDSRTSLEAEVQVSHYPFRLYICSFFLSKVEVHIKYFLSPTQSLEKSLHDL